MTLISIKVDYYFDKNEVGLSILNMTIWKFQMQSGIAKMDLLKSSFYRLIYLCKIDLVRDALS